MSRKHRNAGDEFVDDLPEGQSGVAPDEPITVDPDFEAEIVRRVRSIEDGAAKLIDGEEFLAELRKLGRRPSTFE